MATLPVIGKLFLHEAKLEVKERGRNEQQRHTEKGKHCIEAWCMYCYRMHYRDNRKQHTHCQGINSMVNDHSTTYLCSHLSQVDVCKFFLVTGQRSTGPIISNFLSLT